MNLLMIVVDLTALAALVLVLYHRRHRRPDLVTAFAVVNVGVLAVTMALASAEIGVGVGLGLFGVLSIIRLRSAEISQVEIGYYFAALAIGLVAGFDSLRPLLATGLIVLILATMAVVDSPLLLPRSRQQIVRLDRAHTDEAALRARLEQLLGGTVLRVTVLNLDLVNETTRVDVRWRQAGRAETQNLTESDPWAPERTVLAPRRRDAEALTPVGGQE